MELDLPEKRDSVLYAYIKKENKDWLDDLAKDKEMKLSPLIDHILDVLRENGLPKKKKNVA